MPAASTCMIRRAAREPDEASPVGTLLVRCSQANKGSRAAAARVHRRRCTASRDSLHSVPVA
jgi:hypothetical protein